MPHCLRPARPARQALAVLLLLLTGCGGATAGGTADGGATPTGAQPAATADCDAPELPPLQAGLHLVGDRTPPVPYSSTPPTSGWHRSGVAGPGVADDALAEPVQVGLLERGLVVVTHGPLDDADAAALDELARRWPETVAVAPYAPLAEGEVVAAAWGVLQRCSAVDTAALDAFVGFYGDPRPPADVHGTPTG